MANSYEMQMKALTELQKNQAAEEQRKRDELKVKSVLSGAQDVSNIIGQMSTPTAVELLAKVDRKKPIQSQALGQAANTIGELSKSRNADLLRRYQQQMGLAGIQQKKEDADAKRQMLADQRQFEMNKIGYKDLLARKAEAEESKGRPSTKNLSKGQIEIDKKFGREYADYVAKGGYSDTQKQLIQLKDAIGYLKSTDTATGPLVGSVPRFVRELTNPKSIAAQEAIEEVVQRNLRVILGAQFTQKEGERLIARAFNPKLQESENIKRVERLIKQIQDAAQAKEDAISYFDEYGTLSGFKGDLPKIDDFKKMSFPEEKPSDGTAYAAPAGEEKAFDPDQFLKGF